MVLASKQNYSWRFNIISFSRGKVVAWEELYSKASATKYNISVACHQRNERGSQ